MELKYKLFPYPVLWNVLDDYKTTHFISEINVEHTTKRLKISCDFKTDNTEINNLIKNGIAEFLIHIECPLTAYRNIISTSENHIENEIKETELNGKISICTFIVAKKKIAEYSNYDFNDDYAGISFRIERGTILAIGSQTHVRIDKNIDELASVPSVFSIVKRESNDRGIQIDMENNKITICLNINDFTNYQLISKMPGLNDVLHASFIFPALVYVFEHLKGAVEEYEDYNYRWFKSIKAALKKDNMLLNEDLLQSHTSIELAQQLLDMPTERALNAIINMSDTEEVS